MLNPGRKGGVPPRPPRQTQDGDYARSSQGSDRSFSMGGSQVGGHSQQRSMGGGRSPLTLGGPGVDGVRPRTGSQQPDGATIMEGYRSDAMNGFQEDIRYNPVSVSLGVEKMLTCLEKHRPPSELAAAQRQRSHSGTSFGGDGIGRRQGI